MLRLDPYDPRFTFADMPEYWQVAVMVQQQVQFHRSFGPTPARPVEHTGAQLNGGAVQAQEPILETELLAGADGAAVGQQIIKKPFKKFPGPVRVGVGKRRALGLRVSGQSKPASKGRMKTSHLR